MFTADVVICGAGISGIAAAYHLTVRFGVKNVLLLDERQPLTLTSNKGTEAYRNWWPPPGDTMVRFMNRSIDLLEEVARTSHNCFHLNRRGYLFFTADKQQIPDMLANAQMSSRLGAGEVRIHTHSDSYLPSPAEGFEGIPDGADIVLDRGWIQQKFPFLVEDVLAMTHVRRAGWLDTQAYGQWLLAQAQQAGAVFRQDRLTKVLFSGERVVGVELASGEKVSAGTLVIAAGPLLPEIGKLIGFDFPVFNELHSKITFTDYLGIVPRDLPLMIWNDPIALAWTKSERQKWAANETTKQLLETMPAGIHFRPRGENQLLILWTYNLKTQPFTENPFFPDHYATVLLRGLQRMIPGLAAYNQLPIQAFADGGFYCKTGENRPLIDALPIPGLFVLAAMSGFGYMGSQAAGELLACHVTNSQLPSYAPAFQFARYQDPTYQAQLKNWDGNIGQL